MENVKWIEAIWNADSADPFGRRGFIRIFLKFFITQSFTENTQRFTEKKYFNHLGTIVPERFLRVKILNADFSFVSLWLKKTEDRYFGKLSNRRPKQFGTRIKLMPSGNADLSGFFLNE